MRNCSLCSFFWVAADANTQTLFSSVVCEVCSISFSMKIDQSFSSPLAASCGQPGQQQGRLYSFYIREDFFLMRKEYNQYCQWATEQIPAIRFQHNVTLVNYDQEQDIYKVEAQDLSTNSSVTFYCIKSSQRTIQFLSHQLYYFWHSLYQAMHQVSTSVSEHEFFLYNCNKNKF